LLALGLLPRRRLWFWLFCLIRPQPRPSCADRSALAGVTPDGASGPHGRTSRRAADGAPLLWRRGGRRRRRPRGINARLLLRPRMALVLILFELVLALPLLRVDEDLP
jgi:hypothetical protein